MKEYQSIKLGDFTVILNNFPTKSIYFDFAVKVGSRYEEKTNNGLAHFVEHLYAKNIVNSIKSHPWIKHYINETFYAYTKEDRTNFEFIIHEKDLKMGVRLISKIIQGLKLNKEAIKIEKGIILEELLDYKENIDFTYYKSVKKKYFKNSSLGFEILGTEKNIKKFTLREISEFIKKHYTLDNMILTVSGNFNIKEFKKIINQELKPLPKPQKKARKRKINFNNFCYSGNAIYIKNNEKINKIFFGYYYPFFNADAAKNVEWEFFIEILNNYLFYKITNKLSIYSVDADVRTYEEFSNFSIESSFSHKKIEDFYLLLLAELKKFKKNFTQKEFNYFQKRKMINLDLEKDEIKEVTSMISWYAITFGTDKILTLLDQQKIIKAMDVKKIYYFFDLIFKKDKGTVVIFGKIPESKKQKLNKIWNNWKINS